MANAAKISQWVKDAGIEAGDVKTRKSDGAPVIWRSCHRCGGAGYFNCFGHIYNGKCFLCAGNKGRYVLLQRVAASARAAAKKIDNAPKIRRAKAVKAAASARVFLAHTPGLADALRAGNSDFFRSIARQLGNKGYLSDNQVNAILKAAEQAREKAQDAVSNPKVDVDVPEGRMMVEGTILTVKEQEGFAYGTWDIKTLVEVNNDGETFRVWGTLPRAIDTAVKGDKVRFNATLKGKETGFGFFSRPAKAEMMEVVS